MCITHYKPKICITRPKSPYNVGGQFQGEFIKTKANGLKYLARYHMLYTYTNLYVYNKCIFVCVCLGGGWGRWLRICAHVLDTHIHHHLLGNGSQQKKVRFFCPFFCCYCCCYDDCVCSSSFLRCCCCLSTQLPS